MIGVISGGRPGRPAGPRRWLAAASAFAALFAPAGAEAKWLRAETPHFVIYSDGDEQVLREYALRLEDFDDVLRHYHGLRAGEPAERRLEIYLLRNPDDLQRAFDRGSSVIGFYSATEEDVFAVAHRSRDKESRDETLFHEYTHHFMAQYFPYPYPAWVREGWAEYFQTTDIRANQIDVGNFGDRAYSLSLEWLPIEHLLGKAATGLSGDKASTFYAQAWLLTHYMHADPARRKQLDAYLRAVAGGQDPVRAMETATGDDVATLERKLRAYMRTPLGYMRHGRNAIARAVTVTTLPPSADDLLLLLQRSKLGFRDEDIAPFLAKIRAAAAKHPSDGFAELALAWAEIELGDRAAGEALLKRRLEAAPDEVEALRLMARSKLKSGHDDPARRTEHFAQARPMLAKAYKADPNHYQTLYAYALSRSADPDHPSENTLNILLLASQIAPQVPSIAFEAARALAARGHKEEAIAKLKLLANAPHGGEVAEAAKAELAKLEGTGQAATKRSAAAAAGASGSGD